MRTYNNVLIILVMALSSSGFAVSFQGIGLPSDGISYPSGISANSIVVGDGGRDNWIWANGSYSTGTGPIADISDDGSVMIANIQSGGGNSFYRVVNGIVQTIPGFAQGRTDARAVSADGSKIVGYAEIDGPNPAWIYQNGVYNVLPVPNGCRNSAALSTSSDGSIIAGYIWPATGGQVAAVWENGAIEILPNPVNVTSSLPREISGDGSTVVGNYAYTNTSYACVWRNGAVETLPMLHGATGSISTAVSFDGSLVFGNSFDASWNGIGAFVWDETNGTRLLKDFLENDYSLNLTGWDLRSVSATDTSGNIITGYGINPQGQGELWIATIPEPATLALLGLGGLLLRKRKL